MCRWRAHAGEVEQPLTHSLRLKIVIRAIKTSQRFFMVLLGSQVLVGVHSCVSTNAGAKTAKPGAPRCRYLTPKTAGFMSVLL